MVRAPNSLFRSVPWYRQETFTSAALTCVHQLGMLYRLVDVYATDVHKQIAPYFTCRCLPRGNRTAGPRVSVLHGPENVLLTDHGHRAGADGCHKTNSAPVVKPLGQTRVMSSGHGGIREPTPSADSPPARNVLTSVTTGPVS